MMGGQQIIILKEGTEREKGKGAVFNNIAAARAVADAVKSTLGPKGMDKMLVDSLGDVTITNDGVTILKEIEIEHPTAKMLVEVAKTQDDEVGDGTTSAVVLAGELRADVDNILVQKKHGGNLKDTNLIDGVVLDKERVHPRMPKFVRDAKIALINRALEVKKTEVNEEIRIRDPAKLQMFLDEEEKTLHAMVEKIKASGANVVLAQKGIDDVAQHYLAKEGIYAVRRVKESDMKKLAKATGARSVTNLDDLTAKELGRADLVEERKVGTDDMTFVTGCKKARADHQKKGGKSMGVNVQTGEPLDMIKANVIEPLRVKIQEIDSAAEVAGMILRIDDVIASKKSPPPPPGGGEHGHGGGMGGMGGMPPGMGM